ncbi:MAG: hypothetical protein J5I93_18740 [Pirellulaceae bacterium]|nr:hypothetical protein [Pirellulaceae bacterium]
MSTRKGPSRPRRSLASPSAARSRALRLRARRSALRIETLEERRLLAIDFLPPGALLDFGDLPEGPGLNYRTTLTEDPHATGPIHLMVPNVFLGGNVDAELDGQPTADALGDDQHFGQNAFGMVLATSDEDGVNLNAYRDDQGKLQTNMFYPGAISRIEVHANVPGYLSAWIDYNGDGDFHDANEKIANAQSLSAGPNVLTLNVPLNAVVGQTYARFRFTTYSGDLGPDGVLDNWVLPDGEVEDYRLQIKTPYDFGDAPDSYQTLAASDGPAHRIVTGIHDQPGVHLGSYVDPDMDGQPDPWALGDDEDDEYDVLHRDDEDGVLNFDFGHHSYSNNGNSNHYYGKKQLVAGSHDVAEVVASTDGYLHAWIDFNGDGDFADPTEQIAASLPLTAGLNHVYFNVPWEVAKGESFARFRFTSVAGHLPWYGTTIVGGPNDGVEVDGEVEDYEVLLALATDFGDAPDSYGDASHNIASHFHLGHSVDGEFFTQNFDGHAFGDDTYDGHDDEDGVAMSRTLMPGSTHWVTVTASAVGYLNAWVDFDADGAFDPGDQIFTDRLLNPGDNHLSFTVPAGIDPAKTYARFRFSAETGLGPTGHHFTMDYQGMGNGEVEDYELAIGKQDFGDAPDSYRTLEASLGAAHVQVLGPAPFIGSPADMEHDGQPSSDALGDDQYVAPGALYAGIGLGIASYPGAFALVDQNDGSSSILSDPVTPGGLSGLAFTSDDRLFGSVVFGSGPNSQLIELDPDTGLPVNLHLHADNAIDIVDEAGEPVKIGDLAVQPLTEVLYGIGSGPSNGLLYTIDPATGVATLVGDTGVSRTGGIAFDWYGNLYMTGDVGTSSVESYLFEIDPTSAAVLGSTEIVDSGGAQVGVHLDGLGLRPADGLLFASYGGNYGETIATIDPASGELTELGDTGIGSAGDLAFRPPKPGVDDEDGVFFDPYAQFGLGPEIPLVWGKNTLWIDARSAPPLPDPILLPPANMGGLPTSADIIGYLNAWIDFDQDGSFQPSEQIAIDLPMLAGEVNPLPFTVPVGFAEGTTFARFRISTERGLWAYGLARDGEVEDYQVTLQHQAKDYGDAPDSYATLAASNGASHVLPQTEVTVTHNGVLNLGFEQGLLGWTTGGTANSVEVLEASNFFPGIPPTEGQHFALLSTGPGLVAPIDLPSLDPLNADVDHDTSLLWTSFNLTPSQVPAIISFDWNLLTSELSAGSHYHGGRPSLDDFFGVSLNGTSIANGSIYRVSGSGFADTGPYDGVSYEVTSGGPTDGSLFEDGQTGWQTFQFVITQAGNYTLKFSVADQGTYNQPPVMHYDYLDQPGDFDTGLLIDNVMICVQPQIADRLRLGDYVDPESDGQPTISALGDDLDLQGDDEDGVYWTGDILPGLGVPIQVSVAGVAPGSFAFLDAWIDYNQDGDFDDPGEQFLFSTAVTNGVRFPQTVPVPTSVNLGGSQVPTPTGLTYARIRISSQGALTPRGQAADGEVEDYLVFIGNTMEWLEYGDAPDDAWIPPLQPGPGDPPDYVTLLGGAPVMDPVLGGARHRFDPNHVIYLGERIDMERDGQPALLADGDDGLRPDLTTPGGDPYDTHDDEDGVLFPASALQPGYEATLQITAASYGYLDGWIDYDLDGVFEPSEKIANAYYLSPGVNTLVIDVPTLGSPGDPIHFMTYARFRFSSYDQGLPPTGWYSDGEVEDYKVNISNLDFGDAYNDPADLYDYPTLLSHDGARHIVHPEGPILGWTVDTELDGQPTVPGEAIGDDQQGIDDEDGVWLLDPLIAGDAVRLVVNVVNAGGYFSGWMDYNLDLEWDDDGEQLVFDGVPGPVFLDIGTHTLTFPVPAAVPAGPTSFRFRITSDDSQPLTTRGLAPDGEVEDYVYDVVRADFGDAPDSFGTSLANNGPRHVISPVFLGTRIDAEPDALPDNDARSDDNLNLDDEDGVTFAGFAQNVVPVLATGSFVQVNVVSSVSGVYLNAWLDFDGSGVFDDNPAEHIFRDVVLQAGSNNLLFFVEPSAVDAISYARFRVSSEAGLWATGVAPDGEVEDYKVSIVRGLDFGDAPEPDYSTLLQNPADPGSSDPGPYHEITGLYLGAKIDAEPDGQPQPQALGDDLLDGNDDEDGVWFLTELVPGQMATIKVVSSLPGYLNGWIDFRRDGDWDDNGEHIAIDFLTTGGGAADMITFSVPSYATAGQLTYARFRLSTYTYLGDNLGPDGIVPDGDIVPDGEVEDYRVVLGQAQDWGDAPDGIHDNPPPRYPTLEVHSGARHQILSGVFLGQSVDPEADGQPTALALGDDQAQLDDEDGVVWLTPLVPGRAASIQVTASVEGFLNGWIDFNADGDWNDPNEWIVARTIQGGPMILGGGGPNVIEFWVPETAVVGQTFSRFRFVPAPEDGILIPEDYVLEPHSELGSDGDCDASGDICMPGEVEDHAVAIAPPLDFGDANNSYRTVLADEGPRHVVVSHYHLGAAIDVDDDGQPDPLALGDDLDADGDDEDGVTFPAHDLVPGMTETVTVVASAAGRLDAWLDADGDGVFEHPGEQVLASVAVNPGANLISFVAPLAPGNIVTSMRFRFSLNGGLTPTGPAPDGEVEDYLVALGPGPSVLFDYGDAPSPYPTTLAQDGPRHIVVQGIHLGAQVDIDPDGQPAPGVDGDDGARPDLGYDTNDDEDGVAFTSIVLLGELATLDVEASVSGRLDAWIDFNRDGDFLDAGEQVFSSEPLVAGVNSLAYAVPADAADGPTVSRFRFSTAGGLSPSGPALDGEVEDHPLTIPGAVLRLDLYEADGVTPINDATVAVGQQFVVRINALDNRANSVGIIGLNVDLDWDASLLEYVGGGFNTGDPDDLPITPSFPSARTGTLDQAGGAINLNAFSTPAAGPPNAAIGAGTFESFAMLRFLAEQETSVATLLDLTLNSIVMADNAAVDAAVLDADLNILATPDQPLIDVSTDQIRFTTVFTENLDIRNGTESPLVRPNYPDGTKFFEVTNTGSGMLQISGILFSALLGGDVSVSPLPTPGSPILLAPLATQRFDLRYAPTDPITPRGGSPASDPTSFDLADGLMILSNAVNDPSLDLRLLGASTFNCDISYDGACGVTDRNLLENPRFFNNAPNYDPTLDMDGDGRIDLPDAGVINVEFGGARPLANDDQATTLENVALNLNVRANDVGVGATLVLQVVPQVGGGSAVGGSATVNNNGTPGNLADDTINFVPAAGFTGSASIMYAFFDGVQLASNVAVVHVDVQAASPLLAAGSVGSTELMSPADVCEPLETDHLAPLLAEAIRLWSDARPDHDVPALLSGVEVRVQDLGGSLLGLAGDGLVLLDDDAAGGQWFVDPTPADSSEFVLLAENELRTALHGPAAERFDLLTVLVHELGHLLGLPDIDQPGHQGVMAHELPTGVRRLPVADAAAPVTQQPGTDSDAMVYQSAADRLYAELDAAGGDNVGQDWPWM